MKVDTCSFFSFPTSSFVQVQGEDVNDCKVQPWILNGSNKQKTDQCISHCKYVKYFPKKIHFLQILILLLAFFFKFSYLTSLPNQTILIERTIDANSLQKQIWQSAFFTLILPSVISSISPMSNSTVVNCYLHNKKIKQVRNILTT